MVQIHALALSLEDSYYTQIGAIVTRWAALEYILQNIIWRAMKLDNKQGRVLTVGMGTQVLSGIVRNLPKRWITDQSLRADISALLDEVKTYVEWRNYIVHGIWTGDPKNSADRPWLNYMKTGEERIMPGAEQLTPDNLRDIANAIDGLNQRANKILKAVGGVQLPSLDTA